VGKRLGKYELGSSRRWEDNIMVNIGWRIGGACNLSRIVSSDISGIEPSGSATTV
jgi:hypothetical protein